MSEGESAYYLSVNRNKLERAAGPRPRGRPGAAASGCSPRPTSWSRTSAPGVLERPGSVRTRCGGGIRRSCGAPSAGFARDAGRPGYDFVVQAESGWMSITGEPDGAPMKHGIALADVLAGKDAAIAVLAALVARAADGTRRGVVTRVAGGDGGGGAGERGAERPRVRQRAPTRWGNAHANLVPYQLFERRTGALVIAVGSDAQWLALRARRWGSTRSAATRRCAPMRDGWRARARVVAAMARSRSRASRRREWRARLDAAGVPTRRGAHGARGAGGRAMRRRSPGCRRAYRATCAARRRGSGSTRPSCVRADGGRSMRQ